MTEDREYWEHHFPPPKPHRCCFVWRGDYWCPCEVCGKGPTAEQIRILEERNP